MIATIRSPESPRVAPRAGRRSLLADRIAAFPICCQRPQDSALAHAPVIPAFSLAARTADQRCSLAGTSTFMPAPHVSGACPGGCPGPLPCRKTRLDDRHGKPSQVCLKVLVVLPLLISAAVLRRPAPPPTAPSTGQVELPDQSPKRNPKSWHKSSTPTSCRSMLSAI